MQKQFDGLWGKSFPNGKSKERGGTLVADSQGNLSLQNLTGLGATSGTFAPDVTLKNPQDTAVGVFHTHQYDASEGSLTGLSLSGGDAAYMIISGHSVILAQSGTQQFAFVRTAATPAKVDFDKLNDAQNALMQKLMRGGMGPSAASKKAAAETAKTYHLAYYEGSGGTLTRVQPK